MSDQVGNHEDWFSQNKAHFVVAFFNSKAKLFRFEGEYNSFFKNQKIIVFYVKIEPRSSDTLS